ncbi:hypothetical protein TUMEXPCC7403_02620 [Tumidithrix helvetica PCC 7403]
MVARDLSGCVRELPRDGYSKELPMIPNRAIAQDGVMGLPYIF